VSPSLCERASVWSRNQDFKKRLTPKSKSESWAVCGCRGKRRLARGTSHRHPVSCPRGYRALPIHFPRCSLGAFRLSPVRSQADARVASLPQLWVPQSCCRAAQYLKRLRCLPPPTFDCWASAANDLYWLWGSRTVMIGAAANTWD
jgi:hypothetical protein